MRLISTCLSIMLSGCFSYTMKSKAPPGTVHEKTDMTFLFGLVGAENSPSCASLATVKTYQPWWAFAVTGVTLGIVVPWRAEWSCADDAPSDDQADEKQLDEPREEEQPVKKRKRLRSAR